MSRVAPPTGSPPPATATLPDGERLELAPLAGEVSRRYFEEFPGDLDRYGAVAHEWCVHDNIYILAWTVADLRGHTVLARQVDWLANLLQARDYPLDQLARNLEIAGDVLGERALEHRDAVTRLLAEAAESVRGRSPPST